MQRQQPPTTKRESAPAQGIPPGRAPAYVHTNHADLNSYFMGTLRQIIDDPAVINPAGAVVGNAPSALGAGARGTTAPAIREIGAFCDSTQLSTSIQGYPDGLIPFKISDIMGLIPAPSNVVAITLSPFIFPRVFEPNTGAAAFDYFYRRTMYVTIGALPSSSLTQAREPNRPFAFECRVEYDGVFWTYVHVTPFDDKFVLSTPINIENIFLKFQVAVPMGGMIDIPIPPLEVVATRSAAPGGGPTTFTLVDGNPASVIAPPGAGWNVPLYVTVDPTSSAIPAGLSALICVPTGINAVAYTATTFDLWIDTSGFALDPLERYRIRIPKNSVALCAKFWCLSSTPTNGLVPVHN